MILALLACAAPGGDAALPPDCDGEPVTATAALTDIPTVIRVTWETAEVTTGAVTFDTPRGPVTTAPSTGTTHEALLVGNRAATDVTWRVDTEAPGWCAPTGTTTTGALPASLPDVTLTGDAAAGPAFTVVPVLSADESWVVILDAEGEYVWAWAEDLGEKTTTFYGAELALDGGAILANVQATAADEPGAIHRVGLDGVPLDPLLVDGAHTDFVQRPDGTIATLGWDVREVDGRKFLGDTLVELAPDGTTRTVWDVWDDFSPDTNRTWQQGWYPGDPEVEDWSHVNGLEWDEAAGRYLVTTTFDQSVLAIDPDGTIAWRLADGGGDFHASEPLVDFPHSVQAVDGGVLVFNRGDIHDTEACSEAVEIGLADGVATRAWSYGSERCLLIPFLGSATRRADGSTLVDWTTAGQLDLVDPEGALLWRLNLDIGAAFSFADALDGFYSIQNSPPP